MVGFYNINILYFSFFSIQYYLNIDNTHLGKHCESPAFNHFPKISDVALDPSGF